MDLYRDLILDHYKHPRNFGTLKNPDKSAESYNATCGDRIKSELILRDDQKISQVKFSGTGCAISQAAASMLSEELVGKTVNTIMKLKADHMISMIGATLT